MVDTTSPGYRAQPYGILVAQTFMGAFPSVLVVTNDVEPSLVRGWVDRNAIEVDSILFRLPDSALSPSEWKVDQAWNSLASGAVSRPMILDSDPRTIELAMERGIMCCMLRLDQVSIWASPEGRSWRAIAEQAVRPWTEIEQEEPL
jgi:hypothetical protein